MQIELDPQLERALNSVDAGALFDRIMSLDGEVYRDHKHRRTVAVEIGGHRYFLKTHRSTGWREILKNIMRLRMPTLTSRPEAHAIKRLHELGVPTMTVVGLGLRGRNPARLESFIITEALLGMIHLDELAADWGGLTGRPRLRLQRAVLRELAEISRTLHGHGVNHRDYYLCHFMLPDRDWKQWLPGDSLNLHVIDLHRAQVRRATPWRWIAKDLSGLLFSSLDADISARDLLRFMRIYWEPAWRTRLRRKAVFLKYVQMRALRLYRSEHGRPPPRLD